MLKIPKTAYDARQEISSASVVAMMGPRAEPVVPNIPWTAIPLVIACTRCEISVSPGGMVDTAGKA